MMKSYLVLLFIVFNSIASSQNKLKIIKEDNRFLFYQMADKNDTISKNINDIFFLHLPDSLKKTITIFLEGGMLKTTQIKNQYQLVKIAGMKYSHQKPDSVFNTLVEGHCKPSNNVRIQIINTYNNQVFIFNSYVFFNR